MKIKNQYRIRNWSEYNRSLKQRGSLTFWISEEVINNWLAVEPTGERGRSPKYTDEAIRTMASIKFVFHQAGRQTSGLVESLFALLGIELPVPEHSTVSRRLSGLEIELPITPATGGARHLVCDSTGVKVYGEGEWKVRIHGRAKQRTWRKLHLLVDEASGEVIVSGASTNNVSDDEMFVDLLEELDEPIEQISGDGTYDRKKVYRALEEREIERAAIPPRKGAKIWRHGNKKGRPRIRDENLRAVRRSGKKRWK